MDEAVSRIRAIALDGIPGAQMIVPANAQLSQIAHSNRRFHDILDHAEIVVADGMSVVAASRLLGKPLPERIAGVDLVVEVCRAAAVTGMSVYFLGGNPGSAQKTADNLCARFAGLIVVGVDCPPMGFERDPAESAAVVERISKVAPDFLFVGFGAPKQEYWMEEHAEALLVKVMIAVGGSFDLLSGQIPRAPVWMQHSGFEWVFRLLREQKRLWKRYLFGNAEFIQMVMWQFLTGRKEI